MAVIKLQRVPKSEKKERFIEDLLATFCYYFPQYKYSEAKKMPFVRIRRMLKVANREQALFMAQLVSIAAAPHTPKGSGVKRLLDHYNKLIG